MLSQSWRTISGLIAGLAAIAGTVLNGFFYLLLPILVIRHDFGWYPMFAAAWFSFLVLTIIVAIRSPFRALVVPVVALAVVIAWLTVGQLYLGWSA